MTYNEAKQEFSNYFPEGILTSWSTCYITPGFPLSAYTVFKTYDGANSFVHGNYNPELDKYIYDTYAGATISVVDDSSVENNGLYNVVLDSNINPSTGANKYKLVKLLSEDDNVSGQITVKLKNENTINIQESSNNDDGGGGTLDVPLEPSSNSSINTPYIYFVGVDTSTAEQHPDTLYFNDGIVYDASGSNLFQSSDERLKNIVNNLEPNLDDLHIIDKVIFNWKQDKTHKNNIGVIAQSVEKVYPELVIENPDTGYKMVNYAGLGVVALAAVDKLNERYQILENRLNDLENKINNINR